MFLPHPPLKDIFIGVVIYFFSHSSCFSGHERIFTFEMVLWGKTKGTLQYPEAPLMEILLPPVSTDRALALSALPVAGNKGPNPQVDPALVDAIIEGVSRDDPTP